MNTVMNTARADADAFLADAFLALEDGALFCGRSFGAPPLAIGEGDAGAERGSQQAPGFGEVVINTAMTGYPEALTDRSYRGQMLVMTCPHIGNYGIRHQWSEARVVNADPDGANAGVADGAAISDVAPHPDIQPNALIIRALYRGVLPYAPVALADYLASAGIPGICDVDTRALTMHIRRHGALLGAIVRMPDGFSRWRHYETPPQRLIDALPTEFSKTLRSALAELKQLYRYDVVNTLPQESDEEARKGMGDEASHQRVNAGASHQRVNAGVSHQRDGAKAARERDSAMVSALSASRSQDDTPAAGRMRVLLYDCGHKSAIITCLQDEGAEVTLIPHTYDAAQIAAHKCDLLALSNGPGNPALLKRQTQTVRALIGSLPILAICMGHQLLAQALGARAYKLPFGHHGVNHPVSCSTTERLYVTSQNHEYAIAEDSLPDTVKVWFRNTNDETVEGIIDSTRHLYSVQFHPEASPGPHDTRWIFAYVLQQIRAARSAAKGAAHSTMKDAMHPAMPEGRASNSTTLEKDEAHSTTKDAPPRVAT